MTNKKKNVLSLALLIAVLPPIWAVISPYFGVSVGPISLICAGIYVTNGNKFEDAHKIALGYIMGDIWACLAQILIKASPLNENFTVFSVLFILGFLAVVIASCLPRALFLPSWLAGWAIGMLTIGYNTTYSLPSIAFQIAISMLIGVYYVGALLDKIHKIINKEDRKLHN